MQATIIEWSLLCDYFLIDHTGKYSCIGIFDRIGVPALPALHKSLYVVCSLQGEPRSVQSALLDIWSPDGTLLLSTPESQLQFSDTGRTIYVNLLYDLQLPRAGDFSMTIEAGNRPVGSFSFNVYLVQQ